MSATARTVSGQLVLPDEVVAGHVEVDAGRIAAVERDPAAPHDVIVAPGFIDVHVHGWGGHDAMGGPDALDGMARALARRGVTSFLPTSVSAPLDRLVAFADDVRTWLPRAPRDGADPLGFDMEGPFLAEPKRGAHPADVLRHPADVPAATVERFLDGLRLMTVAPELPGALELIGQLAGRGVRVSLGHSAADVATSRAGYAAGAVSTTHLFNAMVGVTHRDPGLALAALLDDAVFVELIADGFHVDAELWPLIWRLKPADRVLLVSDAIALAGTEATEGWLGALQVRVAEGRVTLVEGGNLAGSITALDLEVARAVQAGIPLARAVQAASANPAALLGLADRGRIDVGLRADIVLLDASSLRVRSVLLQGEPVAPED